MSETKGEYKTGNPEMNSGVYKIVNLINGNLYIGSSKNIAERWAVHIRSLNKVTHRNEHLQRAWDLYGKDNFEFNVVEECDQDFLLDREQYFMDILQPEYNIYLVAGSSKGIKFSMAARANMSIAHMGYIFPQEQRDKMSAAMKGKIKSPETKRKISIAQIGRIHSQETRAKMSIAAKRRITTLKTRAIMSAAMMGNTRALRKGTK